MKTYYEQAQAAYFTAGAALYNTASAVLNDCTHPVEFTGRTYEWSRDLAKSYAEKAQACKEQALAEGAVVRQPRAYNAAQAKYSEAVTRHLRLRQEYLAAKIEAEQDKVARFWGSLNVQSR